MNNKIVVCSVSIFLIGLIMGCHSGGHDLKSDFKKRLAEAYSEKNVEKLASLFYWKGVEPEKKQKQVKNMRGGFLYDISEIEIKEMTPEFKKYVRKGVTYKTNREVVAQSVVSFETDKNTADVTVSKISFDLGEDNGKYYIVNYVPIERSTKALSESLFSINTIARDQNSDPAKYTGYCILVLSNGEKEKLILDKQSISRNVHDIESCSVTFESLRGSLYFSISKGGVLSGDKLFQKSISNIKKGETVHYRKN